MTKSNLPGPKAVAMIERDRKVISPSYPRGYPFVMDHGKGSEVWDVDGNRFLDFMGGIAVVSTGYSHPKVVKAIQEQAEKFIHISSDFYHENWIKLAEKLDEIAPFEEDALSFMTNSGTEAVETAIKLARYGGFYPLMNGVTHAPFPNPYHPVLERQKGEDYGEATVRYIEEEIFNQILPPKHVAGILVETIQGEGGYIVPPDGFYPALRKLCDKHGILMILDEVQCGMGRTGKWWAIEHFGVEPDMITSAKGIASGMPLGACIARKSVMDWEIGTHGNTYGGNPISCAASLATIDLIENGYMQNAKEVGEYAMDALEEIKARHPSIGEVRGKGLMIGVEFVTDRETKEPAKELTDRIVDLGYEHGLLMLSCGKSVIRIAPPLSMSKSEMDEGLKIFEEALTAAEKELI
jgi:4-aminobutyrate aminotransferase